MAKYDVFLLDHQFTRLAYLPAFHSMQLVRTCNDVGAFEIKYSSLDANLLKVDHIVEVWRNQQGTHPARIFSGFLRKWPRKTEHDGKHSVSLVGTDFNDLLERRIVAYKADSKQADKHGPADDIMKAVVRENLGRLSRGGRDLTDLGFTVLANTSSGPVVSKTVEWQTVLSALQKFSEEAAGKTPVSILNKVFFDIVHIGKDQLEFRTWIGQRGQDRTTGSGVCYFSLKRGNLFESTLTYDHSKERNYIYVSGQGKGKKKVVREVQAEDRVGASPWNRCELHESAPSDKSKDGLLSVGEGALARESAVQRVKGSLLDTGAARWGVDWNFGDKVLVWSDGEYLPVVIETLNVKANDKGEESIEVKMDASTGEFGRGEGIYELLHIIKSLRKKVDKPPDTDGFFLDFTGTQWDNKEKCHQAGLRFSDSDSPFPTLITWNALTGTWSHAAGRGWQPFSSTNSSGPAFLFALAQGHEWEIEIVVDYRDATSLTTQSNVVLAYMSNNGNTGAFARLFSTNAGQKQVVAYLYTNAGDDTYTARYTGSNQSGSDNYTFKFRNKSGTVGVWDPEDDAWHDYETKGPSGQAYSAATAVLHAHRYTTAALDKVYIQSIEISYIDRE